MKSMRRNVGSKETGISVPQPQEMEFGQTWMSLKDD